MSQEKKGGRQGEPAPELSFNEQQNIRIQHLRSLQEQGLDPYIVTRFDRTRDAAYIKETYKDLAVEEEAEDEVCAAGRITAMRGHGKASFVDLTDMSDRIQLYFKLDVLGEESYKRLDLADIGDLITVTGTVFRTKRGELSIRVSEWSVVSKSLNPPPEKWHGLSDIEVRYRQRYADMLSNKEVRDVFIKRSRIVSAIRRYLDGLGFLEVETPMMSSVAGGATARPFITHHNALNTDMYLRIATELHLKRCIVGGMEKVYEIGRIFRNEGIDTRHNPEFTTIELYEAWTDCAGMMDITEGIINYCCENVLGTHKVTFMGHELDMRPPYPRLTMDSLLQKYAGISIAELREPGRAKQKAIEMGINLGNQEHTLAHLIDKIFEAACEEHLIQPTFVTEQPVELSPLAKRKASDPTLTDRFELFVCGSELANAFSELNDPFDQRKRFEEQQAQKGIDDEAHPMDEDFLNALMYGMPPTGGMGMGIDRLIMVLAGQDSIRDVLIFPTMKNLNGDKSEKKAEKAGDAVPAAEAAAEVPAEKIDFSKVEIEPLFQDSVDFETFSKSDFRAVKVKECTVVPKSKKLLQFTLDDGTGKDRTILSGIQAYYKPEELAGKTLIAITNLPPRAMMGIESCGMLLSAVHTEEGERKLNLIMVDGRIPAGSKLY